MPGPEEAAERVLLAAAAADRVLAAAEAADRVLSAAETMAAGRVLGAAEEAGHELHKTAEVERETVLERADAARIAVEKQNELLAPIGEYINERTQTLRRVLFGIVSMVVLLGAVVFMGRVDRVRACDRDNDLRRAYINQWQPVLDEAHKHPPTPPGPEATPEEIEAHDTAARQLQAFENAMVTFEPHNDCSFWNLK